MLLRQQQAKAALEPAWDLVCSLGAGRANTPARISFAGFVCAFKLLLSEDSLG